MKPKWKRSPTPSKKLTGAVKDAAKMLGISYKALLYKIRQFGLDSGGG
jgi:DNA-binding NtrC family response regulator